MFEKQFNSFVLSAWLSTMPVCFLTTTMFVFNDISSTTPYLLKTTETTGTTRRTGATAGCHEVTYNWDNKITSAVIGFVPLFYDNC